MGIDTRLFSPNSVNYFLGKKMKYAFYLPNGRIVGMYQGDNPEQQFQHLEEVAYSAVDDAVQIESHYIDPLHFRCNLKPDAPTRYHHWNYDLSQWCITDQSFQRAKEHKKTELTLHVEHLHDQPVFYDFKWIDADAIARENIQFKINQIRTEIEKSIESTNLFWMDANNDLHHFMTAIEYQNWLQGLMLTIANRRTFLYQKSWLAKQKIDALTDVSDVVNFPIIESFC